MTSNISDQVLSEKARPRTSRLSGWIARLLRLAVTLIIPPLLVLTSVRIVMTDTFLTLEYNRPGFPPDRYGFTTDDRLNFAPYAVNYLLNDADISYLGNLTFPDGTPLFNARELRHMEDVKTATGYALTIHKGLVLLFAFSMILLVKKTYRSTLWQGMFGGGLLTILLILGLVTLALANWDYFFDNFHATFFEGDTWVFRTSDSLIRLFPEQFWFDTALTIGLLTILGSLAFMALARRMQRPTREHNS